MTTRPLVDPELAPLLDQLPAVELTTEILKQVRAGDQAMRSQKLPDLPAFRGIEVSERQVPGPAGSPEVRVLLYQPGTAAASRPALLLMHGGGYIMGTPEQEDFLARNVVSTVGCVVVAVDYRVAPETRYPGAVEDCYAALKWLYAHVDELGVDATRLAIGGSSAGGGLAAALGLLTRDRGEIALAFQLLLQPMLDDRTCTLAEPHPYTGEFIWTHQANRFGWTSLLGHEPGLPDVSPYAAAARAGSLEGLPPTFISTGALDLFLEEDLEYARRLTRAGVPTEFHLYPGTYHGFRMAADAQVTQNAMRDQLAALKRVLGDPH